MQKQYLIQSICFGATVAVLFVVGITIAGELYKVPSGETMVNPIKDFLKALHGHHWVGKGIWAMGTFGVVSLISYGVLKSQEKLIPLHKLVSVLAYTALIGTLVLYGFFTYEYFVAH